MPNTPSISCLIAAYNEGPRIAEVLKVVSHYPGFREVLVIDDGSSDTTAMIVAQFPVTLVRLANNQGKTAAVYTGLKNATGNYICMLDGDLTNVTESHLTALIEPTLSKECMVIARLQNAWPLFQLTGLDPWSGERVIPKWILEEAFKDPKIKRQPYVIESKINQLVIQHNLPIYTIKWSNVHNIPKYDKDSSFIGGIIKELKMYYEVYSDFGFARTLRQQLIMPFLVKKKPDS